MAAKLFLNAEPERLNGPAVRDGHRNGNLPPLCFSAANVGRGEYFWRKNLWHQRTSDAQEAAGPREIMEQ